MKERFLFPLNIQLFADDGSGNDSGNDGQGNNDQVNDGQGNDGQTGQEPKVFSQEEVDKIVQGRIAKERKSWEKQLQEQQTEAQKLEKMSEKEKKKYQEEKRIKDLDDREAAITRRELTAQAKVQLADKGIPTELAEILILTDADSCKKSIETVEKAFQTAVQRAVEERIKGREPMKKAKDAKLTDEELVYQKMMGKQEVIKYGN